MKGDCLLALLLRCMYTSRAVQHKDSRQSGRRHLKRHSSFVLLSAICVGLLLLPGAADSAAAVKAFLSREAAEASSGDSEAESDAAGLFNEAELDDTGETLNPRP